MYDVFFLQVTTAALEWIESREFNGTPEEITNYKNSCAMIYPRAQAFKPPQPPSLVNAEEMNDKAPSSNHNHVDSQES